MDDEIKKLIKEAPPEENPDLNITQDLFEKFLLDLKGRMDKHCQDLGYICFIFDKSGIQEGSSFITNGEPLSVPFDSIIPHVNRYKVAKNKKTRRKLGIQRIK